jgi:hypothetical protein
MKAALLFTTCLVLSLVCSLAEASSAKPTVYVADFFTRDREITPLTTKLTSEFEFALSGTGRYDLLERRDFDQLRAQAKNEAAIAEISGMSGELVAALKTRSADMVVFGEVFDDIDSGQVSVTVSFVTFTGEKKLMLNGKIPRGKVNDADSRSAAMEELVKKVVSSARRVIQSERNGILFQISRCRASERVVIVELVITNNEDDKRFQLGAGDTVLFDNNGNRIRASSVRVANQAGNSADTELISGVPVRATIEFQGVNANAVTVARLDISCWEGSRRDWFITSFRNLAIER